MLIIFKTKDNNRTGKVWKNIFFCISIGEVDAAISECRKNIKLEKNSENIKPTWNRTLKKKLNVFKYQSNYVFLRHR